MSDWLIKVIVWPTDRESSAWLVALRGEGLHEDGNKVQMEMKAGGVFSSSGRQIADLVCSELRLRWARRLSVHCEVRL